MANKPITKSTLIAVEGLDYLHLLLRSPIVNEPQFNQSVLLWDFKEGGVTLGQFLGVVRSQRNFGMIKKLGLIFDAEFSAATAAQSVRGHLQNQGFVVPAQSNLIAAGQPAVAYLVMPDGKNTGCLEHACLEACAKPNLVPCADAFLQCVGGQGLNQNWQAKLRVHSIIAGSVGNPAMTLGESGAAGIWDFAHPALASMLDFIRALY
jgi:hypothetical protein